MKWALAGSALFLFATIAGAALWLRSLPPQTETFVVALEQPGVAAETLARDTTPIERALLTLPGTRAVRATWSSGRAEFHVEVTPGADVSSALNKAKPELPDTYFFPTVMRVVPGLVEERYVLTSETRSLVDLSRWARDELDLAFAQQPGVRDVEWCGLVDEEVRVTLDLPRLRATGHTPEAVRAALGAATTMDDAMTAVRDVARVSRESVKPACLPLRDGQQVLVLTVRHERERPLTMPALLPGVTLERMGARVEEWSFIGPQPPRVPGLVLARGHRLTAFSPLEPAPGLALVKREGGVAVRVFGAPELAKQTALELREALANEPGWTGVVPDFSWPVMNLQADRPDARRLLMELLSQRAGELADRTPITLHVDDDALFDVRLPDGTPLSMHVRKTMTEEPESLLRIDGQPVIEFFTGVADVERVVKPLQLPPGVHVTVAR